MPWKQTDPMNERLKFIALSQEGLYSMSELCARFGISRPTGYKILARYAAEGTAALQDRSHAPKHCPHRIPEPVQAVVLEARRAHPHWGPRKILAYVGARRPELKLPAASTLGDLFTREGLTERRPRRRQWRHPGRTSRVASAPNELWTIDFKGNFRTGDGLVCYPLTVADAHTRFLLGCDVLGSVAHRGTQAVVERLFRTYGLPQAIRSDNGGPFCTQAIAGLSRLNIWWLKLGIGHDRIEPGHPEQNGSHERMHLTMKQDTQFPPAPDAALQQERYDGFRGEFNHERPHEALGMRTPGSLYTTSARALPERLPDPEYPGHCHVRQVRGNGILYFRNREIFLSELLIGERVAMEETEDGIWSLLFYNLLLGRLDERTGMISG